MLKRHPVKSVVLGRRAQKQARNAATTTISNPPTPSKSFSTSARPAREEANYNYEIMARALSHPETPKPYVRKIEPCQHQPEDPMDGNQAAAYIAYAMSETSFIYPISPATSMGEHMDNWASQGRKNSMGQVVRVTVMQSEAGAAGACHGSVAAGVLTSTFTASQGLLLMIPNLYLMAGELMPIVLHVSARTVSKHALSIFNDHSDVMACRQTGFALLCSNSVQEVMDLGLVAHLASIRSRVPFLHFFDGYRTSAEISKIKVIPYADIARLIPEEELRHNLRDLALNPQHPIIRGTGQRPDIFFQSNVANQRFYDACPDIVQSCMDEVAQLTGRQYKLYEYYGSETAERVVIMMGSAAETAEDVVDHMNSLGENVGLLKVRLFRPFKSDYFVKALPKTVKKVAVLDRTREEGAQGNPLYLDVVSCLTEAFPTDPKMVIGGTYGLASKEFTPGQLKAVFDNLNAPQPKRRFVVGILDDVTNTSLTVDESFDTIRPGITQCMFWGLGGDGTIGANKSAIKNLAKDGGLNAQGYFSYDSHKEMGATVSHLRFGKTKIKAHYMINNGADYIASHHPSYTRKFDLCAAIRQNGIFVLNCPWSTLEEVEENLPPRLKRQIASRNVRFYVINATRLAMDLGLGMRINTLMQSCFYRLSGVLPVESALNLLKNNILELYSKKGPEVVKANQRAVDAAGEALIEIKYPSSWAEQPNVGAGARELKDKVNVPKPVAHLVSSFVKDIMDPVLSLDGDQLPVSRFIPGGFMPTATCMHEERGLAAQVPVWEPDKCTQCNYCAIVCPHAVIRPFLMDKSDLTKAPEGFESRRATGGAEFAGLNFSITISTNDCTGCAICVASCPDDALHMEPYEQVRAKYGTHWDYVINLPNRNPADKMTVKGSQFQQPLLEFSGACPGCGETPYVKLVTQLFGDRMVIANASGCSSVWGGTATTNPYTVNEKGQGPAWGRSLFEDNAEYGFGMALGTLQRRLKLKADVEAALATVTDIPKTLKSSFEGWLKNFDNYDASDKFVNWIEQQIPEVAKSHPILQRINNNMDVLRPQSHWIIGGDGWAYDIGFGGLDHVLSRGENVNILVLDTEMYSNTGGQVSKSTQMSTVLKFAQSGKKELKKDLGIMAMTYGNVYVASVALGANYNQCVQAFKEAESYPGTSLILCYSPCIDWGIDMQYQMESQRIAVDSGYWKLYRYDPRLTAQGKVPMQLDSPKIKTEVKKFLETQNRFKQLLRKDKKKAESYFSTLTEALANKHESVKRQSMDNLELLDHLKSLVGETSTGDKALVLYASETGTAADVAKMFANELKRRHIRSKCVAMDDYDFDNLPSEKRVFIIGATCGQGEFPANSRTFWKMISDPTIPSGWLKDTQYAVFSLGDHAYVYYNKVGKDLDARFAELGAQRIVPIGLANEKDDEKWETAWTEWVPELWNELGTEAPPEEIPVTSFKITAAPGSTPETDVIIPQGAKLVPLQVSQLLCSPDYDRDIRHFEFDLSKSTIAYNLGDSLGVYPWNELKAVNEFLNWLGVKGSDVVSIQDDANSGKFPTTVTLEQVFTQVLDIFGRPSRKFYETLALLAKDPKEANEIRTLMSKEGKPAFKQFLKETPNYVDLLQRWPSAKLSVEQLLEFVPKIKPRLYSIASAPSMDGDRLHLCIVADDWRTPSGRYKHGLTTRYLRDLTPTNDSPVQVAVRVNNASFTLPANHKQPLLLVGLGTGIAPCRALIRDRLNAKRRGEEVGPIALFFGVRTRAQEYSYGEEWDELHKEGLITILANAFSRDQEKKIYVQHRIAEHSETVYNWIVKNNGYYLLCGPGGPPCVASKEAIIQSLVDHGAKEGFDKEKAVQYVTDMQISGRYNEEVW